MKQIFYSFRYLIKSPASQIVKIVSLTLGLAVGLLIFAKVAFEKSFDNFFPDSDRIYQMVTLYSSANDKRIVDEDDMMIGPMAPTLAREIPQVEKSARTAWIWQKEYFYEDDFYSFLTIMAESSLFDVLDYGMLQGDPQELDVWNHVLISESAAQIIFKDENPVGQTILYNKRIPLTIKGVFKDVPRNSQVQFDLILSLKGVKNIMGWRDVDDWSGGIAYRTYIKLHPGTKISDVEAQMPAFCDKYGLSESMEEWGETFIFRPINKSYSNRLLNKQVNFLLTIMALVVLFISAMNYVLISISSLGKRTKTIAVQKCNGARNGNVFGQFLTETALLILASLVLTVLLLVAFRNSIQPLTGETLATLFAPRQLTVMLWVVLGFVLLAGVIPGRIFSHISVTQAFKEVKANKKWWKQLLLLIQFICVTFVLIFLLIIVRQYNLVSSQDVGYEYETLAYLKAKDLTPSQHERLKNELQTLPFVEKVSSSEMPVNGGLSGAAIFDPESKSVLFAARYLQAEHNFLSLLGVDMKYGEYYKQETAATSIIVNETFAQMMHWEGNPVGKEIAFESSSLPLEGVVNDFQVCGIASAPQDPVLIQPLRISDTTKLYTVFPHIRLNNMTPDNLETLTNKLQELLPDQKIDLRLYSDDIRDRSHTERMIRNIVLIASVIIFLIALTGLIGYVNDEVRRRRREIAIRRINGALIPDILRLISRDILIMASLAILIGVAGAYIVSEIFIRNFPVQVFVTAWSFIGGAVFVLFVIILTIVIRAWQAATENPANTIKIE